MDFILGQRRGQPNGAKTGGAPAEAPVASASDGIIVEGTQATFMRDVVEASRTVPIIVDFWATWCGPCKQLSPALEKVVRSAGGRVRMVKIDVDKNQALVRQLAQLGLPLQSIPTVAAFWQGQIADLFQGALPESEIRRFIEALLKLTGGAMPAADLVAEAKTALEAGELEDAESLFRAVLEHEPENAEAFGGLVRTLLALGQEDEAREVLAAVPPKLAEHADVAGARSALALAEEGRAARAKLSSFERRIGADPNDHQARYELASALNAMGRREEAADALLEIIRRQRGWNEDAARLQLLKFFEAWGVSDPTTMAARRKLSTMLFS